jgi:hypothetical protein
VCDLLWPTSRSNSISLKDLPTENSSNQFSDTFFEQCLFGHLSDRSITALLLTQSARTVNQVKQDAMNWRLEVNHCLPLAGLSFV